MNKFFVTKIINWEILDDKIDEFIKINNKDPYIFMNKKTISSIPTAEYNTNYFKQTHKSSSIIGYYCGFKVFEDDTLEFGEVEIR